MCCGILLGLPTTAQSNTSAERSQQLILLHSTFTYALPALEMGYRILYYYVCAGPQGKSILKQTKGFVRAGASHENQSSDRGRKKIILFLVALGFPPAGLLWSGEFFKPQLARWLQKTCATESASHEGEAGFAVTQWQCSPLQQAPVMFSHEQPQGRLYSSSELHSLCFLLDAKVQFSALFNQNKMQMLLLDIISHYFNESVIYENN